MNLLPQDTSSRDFYIAALFLNLVLFIFIGIILLRLPPVVPLFYSRPWGEEQLVPKLVLFVAPALSMLFLAINYFLARNRLSELFAKDLKKSSTSQAAPRDNSLLILRILSFCSLTAALLACVTILRVALIVT